MTDATDSPTPSPLENEQSASQQASPGGPPDRELRDQLSYFQYKGTSQGIALNDDHIDYIIGLFKAREAALLQRVREETPVKIAPNANSDWQRGFDEAITQVLEVLDNIIGGKDE